MSHSDDKGLVIPPKLAPVQVVIVPIYKGEEGLQKVTGLALDIKGRLVSRGISVKYDDRDTQRPGWKFAEYEMKGIPMRIAIGERDLANSTVEVARRDTMTKDTIPVESIEQYVENTLQSMQTALFMKAKERLQKNTHRVDSYEEFKNQLDSGGGFIMAHWDGTAETETKIKEETKATIRCIPLDNPAEEGRCIYSGRPSRQRVIFARAY
jgi:prolyl-tRNA synthetase